LNLCARCQRVNNMRTDKYKDVYTRTRTHVYAVTQELQACT